MSAYLFSSDGMKNFIVIPASVVDRYMKDATGDQLKILLFLIRNEDKKLDMDYISEATGISPAGLEEAIDYWVKNGVLQKRGFTLSLATPSSDTGLPKYSTETVALRCENDAKWQTLRFNAERILGKLLNENDINTLFSIYDYLGMPDTVIGVMLEYCAEEGKTNMKYIEKTAVSWWNEQIVTLSAADKKVETLRRAKQLESKIKSALGIFDRNLTTKEKGFIDTWTNTFGYGLNEIVYAYEQSADNTGKLSFPYMNKVLETAYKNGLKTAEEMADAPKPDNKPVNNKKFKNNSTDSMNKDDIFIPFWEVMDDKED